MKKVFLQYNPFTIETVIEIDNEPVSVEGALYSHRNNRLQEWLDELFPELVEECNDDIQLAFKGTELDYEDVFIAKEVYDNYGNDNRVNIELSAFPFAESAEKRLKKLIDLFDSMQKDCPFPDLQTKELRRQFQHAVETEFEVSVIATMSSGKSTLINALLGRELMPSKNAACTATIAHIKDVDGMEGFSAICKDENGEIVESNDNLTPETMERYNDDENVVDIDIAGDIPFASSQNMQLVLLDTPGPNNSRTDEHKRRTLRVIKSDAMPMVLYVMNATQLFTNDDETLFSSVADAMNSQHGKQSRDRFLFVINKTDMLDPEKGESVDKTIQEVRSYLSSNGIEDANIYPVSAEMAKLIRMNKNGAELTRRQRRDLEDSVELFSMDGMQLDEYAPLSTAGRNALMTDIKSARINGSAYDETLVHTGVPAVEIAIAEYLEKYALTSKINEAVNTFKRRIDEKQLTAKLEEEMSINEQMRKEVKENMKVIQAQLKDGKEAQTFRKRLESLDYGNSPVSIAREIGKKYAAKLTKVQGNSNLSVESANNFINHLKKQVSAWERDLQTDLEKMIEQTIVKNSKLVLDEYRQHIQSLFKNDNMKNNIYNFDTSFKIMTAHIPSTSVIVNQYTETRSQKVKVGEETVSDSTWWKPWTWGDSHQENIYEDREIKVIDGKRIVESIISPLQMSFNKNIDAAKSEAKRQADGFKKYFIGELDRLDAVVLNKTKELASAASDEEYLNQELRKNRSNQKWLSNFQEKLDSVIKL